MTVEIPIHYNFSEAQDRIYEKWLNNGSMKAVPDGRENRYVIMMPLPNITGALHMGHAMDNVMQDLLIRWHRMLGDNTLWMPGTDHAGIATQAVVERRLFELEGKTRRDIGREALVRRIWMWKDEYQNRIIKQQQKIGCSCDWELQRFTMDRVCSRAVREAFFRLFADGLIYRGYRLVNWDCQLQTAISDDEIEYETVRGYFWHIRYPVIEPQGGEPSSVTVATTRPETMLGDTAVAVHPDPENALHRIIDETRERVKTVPRKERAALENELHHMEQRRESHLPTLLKLVQMSKEGRMVNLPLLNRHIPLILDEWAKPELGSGCVKITPAHDANDYDVWTRHCDEIDIINLLNPDGTYNENAGQYAGLPLEEVRARVIEDLEKEALLEKTEAREIEIGHSERSKAPIEPYLSKQWFIRMGDREGGIRFGTGTSKQFEKPGLAQAAIDAVNGQWSSPTGLRMIFYPDHERYSGTYCNWLSEKRDWCISRQLWWGHRIPIWHGQITKKYMDRIVALIGESAEKLLWGWISDEEGTLIDPANTKGEGPFEMFVCIRNVEGEKKYATHLEAAGLIQDPDVLDTWFSSALWPFSTLGWPDPENAPVERENRPLRQVNGYGNYLEYYYPGSCLVTARDIITQWVARMLVMGLYLLGDVPFTHCFIHANIQDGKGERMSKSKGNGIDPIDIIEEYGSDAMRYVLCDMQTGTQDIRLPVQAISPYTGDMVDLAEAKHGRSVFTYICPKTGREFDVLGTIEDLPKARVTSDRFAIGRAFCTKLWNAARFALMNLGQYEYRPVDPEELEPEDLWILSRLSSTIEEVTRQLEKYNPSAAIGAAREFFWSELCDWYLEFIKPRLKGGVRAFTARSVLTVAIDQILRLFHPFVPFITETLWEKLNTQAPVRGIEAPFEREDLLISTSWPKPLDRFKNSALEEDFLLLRQIIRAIRDLRARYSVSPSRTIGAVIKARGKAVECVGSYSRIIENMASIGGLEYGTDVEKPPLAALQVLGDMEIYVEGVLDPVKERAKLEKQKGRLLKNAEATGKKLANPHFLRKAPRTVVENEKRKLQEIKTQLTLIEQNLDALS
jgi:valyl-tRNA synthetase